jgi:protein-S-isoprenylcysteine O-methyltransferase Ste14
MDVSPSSKVIFGCWLLFFLYWVASASSVKAVVEKQSPGSRLAYRAPTLIGYLLLFWAGPNHAWLNVPLTPNPEAVRAAGALSCVGGLAFAIWARRTLAGNWSSSVTFKQDHELIETGPYRYVRHPIYTGMLLMALGSAIARGSERAWLGLVVMTIGFSIKLRQEEALMLRHFPDTYRSYRSRVKALVPFIF